MNVWGAKPARRRQPHSRHCINLQTFAHFGNLPRTTTSIKPAARNSAFAALSLLTLWLIVGLSGEASAQGDDPLPSWNDGPAKQSILTFVEKVTKEGSPDFVPKPERIAVFDNDGTLWAEQPIYTQVLFLVDRIKTLAPQHPEWKTKEPYASLLKGDLHGVAATGEAGFAELMAATHSGMITEEFSKTVSDWVATEKHPKTGKLYTEMVSQPRLELLAYLRANGFKTLIVSTGRGLHRWAKVRDPRRLARNNEIADSYT